MKRILLYILTNIAVVAMVSIALFVIQLVFGVNLDPNTTYGLLLFSFIFGFAGSIFSLLISRWVALRSVGGKVIEQPTTEQEQWIFGVISRLAQEWGFKMPQVAIYPSNVPNAFATGPTKNKSLVAVSTGLLALMNRDEVEGVLGHEMSHIGNGDMVTMTLLQGILNTFVIFFSRIVASLIKEKSEMGDIAYFVIILVCQFVFGLLASIILMWFSRYREYHADAGSAKHVGAPKMIAALKKLGSIESQDDLPKELNAFGINRGKDSIFSTHPSINNRILALQGLKKI